MSERQGDIAVAIICKTPAPGQSKTRLCPPLHPNECAAISACFIRDLSRTIDILAQDGGVTGYAVYTPRGSESALRRLLPQRFRLMPQGEGDLGARLLRGTRDLLDAGHAGAILVNSDSPTLPIAILRQAVAAVRGGSDVVLSPALDGGYTLIGLSKGHETLFSDMPWSTPAVYPLTLERAAAASLSVVNVPGWYDVDDHASFRILEGELSGQRPAFTSIPGADAPATRQFVRERQSPVAATA
jgi:rSAM/selenodomain-associated transferase 1